MKKVLIIGGAGFVGGYLSEILLENGFEVHSTCLPDEKIKKYDNSDFMVHNLDILDRNQVDKLLNDLKPDIIYHLAAQSSVALSWKNPQLTVDVNIKGSLNVLDSLRDSGLSSRIILIGSGEEYGYIRNCPVSEEEPPRPSNIYAATKAFQSMIGDIYARAYKMDIIRVRAFNHVGARQLPQFVLADFCKQVAEIEKGLKAPEICVGNLDAKRDFTDVRDVVRAYMLLGEKGKSGELYNVGSGHARAIREILDIIISNSEIDIKITVDPERLRPSDIPVIEADISKIKADTGWQPEIPIEETIKNTLDYWRK